MGNKLEQLLNSLIEKGWKPFGMKSTFDYVDILCNQPYRFKHLNSRFWASLRELVSKESWLWQFVCENELVKPVVDIISICSYSHFTDDHDDGGWDETFPEYRIIESALCDGDKLEDFLLSNIKVDEKDNM